MGIHLHEIISIVVLAVLSAFFSASETALFSLGKADLHRFSRSGKRVERAVHSLMREPQKILITILIANLFVNIGISALSAKLLLTRWVNYGHIISIFFVTPAIILLCEISPKVIAISIPGAFVRRVYPLIMFFHWMLYPIRIIMMCIANLIVSVFRLDLSHSRLTEDELGQVIRKGAETGAINQDEGEFIGNIIRFAKKEAANIMFPRNRAVIISEDVSLDEAVKVMLENDIVRVPVYREDLDHISGFVDSKDLMPYYLGYKSSKSIGRFIRPIEFFPSTRELNDLLNDFLEKRIQMAVIVDEYGGTAGIVTLNRILSELMGKDFNKWEVNVKPEIRRISKSAAVVSAAMQITDFNYRFDERIDSNQSDTVGGYLIEKLGHLPGRGEQVETERLILRVRYIRKNRIESVDVIKKEGSGGD